MDKNRYCVIMAGGIGSRFWPVSRNAVPKQFLDILGTGRSFLQETFRRFLKIVPRENILIVTSEKYDSLVRKQLPELLPGNLLLEPQKRNTAPCIAYSINKINEINPEATIVVSPSDHLILDEDVFLSTISSALDFASHHNYLMTLGIKPTRPETGYGYIQGNIESKVVVDGHTAYSIKTFTEKPNAELAKVFVESGEFLWNSGIFVWNLKTIMNEIKLYLPDISAQFEEGRGIYNTPGEAEFIKNVYANCDGISIDYGVMEKTDKSWVFEASFGWSDLGTWDSLYEYNSKDNNGNMVHASDSMLENVSDSIVYSEEKDKLVVASDLKNYMVINTRDVLLVCPRNPVKFKGLITDMTINDLEKYQ
ncbi:MAG: mannose-1-phosphate guanylyltransferase [Bacteroidales bacterium]|nr:mannose-1-phosphate guanylyltransferase [Bacteroidales bacterium]